VTYDRCYRFWSKPKRCAIRVYTDICNITFGKDHRTYELSLAILNEEIEHEAWFSEFLVRDLPISAGAYE